MTFLFFLGLTVLVVMALRRHARLQTKVTELTLRLDQVASQLEQLQTRGTYKPPLEAESDTSRAEATADVVSDIKKDAVEAGPEAPAMLPQTSLSRPDSVNWKGTAAPAPAMISEAAEVAVLPARDVEQALASRWFVWIGGIAIAIGGVLFVKYAFDSGWISPLLRCVLGFVGGLVLIAGSEYLRRTPLMQAQPSYVPAALAAAGLVVAFGSVYAAYAFYQLISPIAAFLVMAALALAAFALSLLQGPLIAALGLIGSYVTPTLIPSEDPSAWTFFPYVLVILAAALAILRLRTWWWLGFAAVAGSLGWGMLWAHGGTYEPADALPLGLFGVAVGAASMFGISGRSILLPDSGQLGLACSPSPPLAIGLAGLGAGLLIACANTIASDHATISLLLLLVSCAGILAVGWLKPGIAVVTLVAGLLAWLTVSAWSSASFTQIAYEEWGAAAVMIGPGARGYLAWLSVFGFIFAIAGYAGSRWQEKPLLWSVLTTSALILFVLSGAFRAHDVLSNEQWAAGGFVIAAILALLIWNIRSRLSEEEGDHTLGILAIGSILLAAYGLYEALDHLWLSFGLAALVPILALASTRIRISLLGSIAASVAALVIIRLFMAREIWSPDLTIPLGQHWPLYGYGVPAILFWISSRIFSQSGYQKAVVALEGSAIGLIIAMISMELRIIINGDLLAGEPGLLEVSAHALAWLGAACGLMYRQARSPGLVSLWGSRILTAAATTLVTLGSLLYLNPVFTGEAVAGGPVINSLLLSFLAPAVLGAVVARHLSVIEWDNMKAAGGILSLVLLLVYLTLETKRLFQGPVLVFSAESDAENYSYSAIWLLAALSLFVAGIRFDRKYIRLAGLAVMMLVVLKVFLIDLSGIGGLYRIASFIGLGLCLVGIGWLYTRFVQKPVSVAQAGG